MAPVTEIATLPLKAGSNIEDPNSSTYTVWQSALDTIASQDGFQRLYWGRKVEAPSEVAMLIGRIMLHQIHRPLHHYRQKKPQ